MIDVMNVHCPHCSRDFAVDVYVGEESSNYNASLIRKNTQHVNWSEISEEIGKGYGNEILSVGDTISFYLKNNKQVSVSVAAINPYENNTVAFVFDDLFPNRVMNERGTNSGGWAKSDMVDALENEILPLLPDELTEVIKPRTIIQLLDGAKYERTSKLWIPSKQRWWVKAKHIKTVILEIYISRSSAQKRVGLKQWRTEQQIGTGFVPRMLVTPPTSGMSAAMVAPTSTTALASRLAFAPASSSKSCMKGMFHK